MYVFVCFSPTKKCLRENNIFMYVYGVVMPHKCLLFVFLVYIDFMGNMLCN